ncbi:MAG: hypothetical protein ACRDV1_10955 [Actinomycetes bacterium]
MTRKDNGLHATSYERLVDVETHVVDGLLERLRDGEVAAYVAPATGRRGPYGDTVLPESPSDSVFVDSQQTDRARRLVDGYLAEVREELAWAGIVAGFDSPSADEVPRWPADEDVDPEEPGQGRVVRPAETTLGFEELRAYGEAAGVREGDGDAAEQAPRDDPGDHYVPPPPPPVPMPDTVGRFAWAGVVGGPLFLLLASVFGLDISGWPGFLALAAFMGGFVTLVARMNDRPPAGSGDDDGAVV